VLANPWWKCSLVNPTAPCRLAGVSRTGNRNLIWARGLTRTPSGPAEEVADDDRWRVGAADHFDEMTEGVEDRRIGDHLRMFAQFLHLDLEAPIRRHDDLMTARPVVHHPAVPTSSGHPAPVVQHDRWASAAGAFMVFPPIGVCTKHRNPPTGLASPRTDEVVAGFRCIPAARGRAKGVRCKQTSRTLV